jgi:trehalose transport system substrate-binding protein
LKHSSARDTGESSSPKETRADSFVAGLSARASIILLLCCVCLDGCWRDRGLTFAAALLPGELPVYRSVVAAFEKREGVRVNVIAQQYADIRRALSAEALAGSGSLDLVELDVYSLALAAGDVAELRAEELGSDLDVLSPAALGAGEIHGLRFLPHRVSWQAMIYDHQVLGEPPVTWEQLLAVARAHPGKIGLKGALYEGLTCDVLPFVWSAGGSGESFDDRGAQKAFAFLHELAPFLHPQSATFKESTIAEAMARGELVVHLNWPFVMSLYASQGLAPGRIRSAPLPRPADLPATTVLGGGYIAIPRGTRRRELAVRLARHLIAREAQETFRRELGWFSARKDVAIARGSPLLAGFEAMRDHVAPRPERQDYPQLSRLWQRAFRAVAFEDEKPAAALEAAERKMREVGIQARQGLHPGLASAAPPPGLRVEEQFESATAPEVRSSAARGETPGNRGMDG